LRTLTLALCFTESRLNYNVKHKSRYDVNTKGICGIKPCWDELLGKVPKNSLQAGSIVIGSLLAENGNNLNKALYKYKGAKKSHKEVNEVLKLYKDLR
jgi:hypothetical protein